MKNVLQIVNDMIKIDDIILLLNYLDLKVKLHCYLNYIVTQLLLKS